MLQAPLEETDQILSFQLLLPLEAGEAGRVVRGLELEHQADQVVEVVLMAQGREVLETHQTLPHHKEIMVEMVSLPIQIILEAAEVAQGR
jgi:seryl-tRNA synthetase